VPASDGLIANDEDTEDASDTATVTITVHETATGTPSLSEFSIAGEGSAATITDGEDVEDQPGILACETAASPGEIAAAIRRIETFTDDRTGSVLYVPGDFL
jgi:hypothetical protein